MTGWHVAHVNVVRHLIARHYEHMLWQHCQVEQCLHASCFKSGQVTLKRQGHAIANDLDSDVLVLKDRVGNINSLSTANLLAKSSVECKL